MSSKLVPANPSELMVIRTITPNVVTFSVPFARFGILNIGGRGTLGKRRRWINANARSFCPEGARG